MSNTSKKLLTNFFKKHIFVKIILLLILIGFISLFRISFDFSNNNTTNLATLIINFETEKRFFEGEVAKDMTILEALSLAVSVGEIRFNYVIDESGNVNVLEIDGHTNGVNNKYFVFYLNSEKVVTEDLNKKIIHNGDRIEITNE